MPLTSYSLPVELDQLMGGAAPTIPATWYVGIFTTTPTSTSTGVEVSGGSYARVSKANNNTNFPATSGNIKSNGTAIQFPTSTAAWGLVTAWGLFDAATTGNLWFYGTLTSSITLNSGDSMQFAVGTLNITF
jgi:hypothetical protein